jgi:hypothetical protein
MVKVVKRKRETLMKGVPRGGGEQDSHWKTPGVLV